VENGLEDRTNVSAGTSGETAAIVQKRNGSGLVWHDDSGGKSCGQMHNRI